MKNYVLALVGLLCCLAAPPSCYAGPPPARDLTAVYEYKPTAAPVLVFDLQVLPAARAVVVAPVHATSTAGFVAVLPNATRCGATLCAYLSTSEAPLRVRPGWRGSVGSAFTEYKAAGLRYS